MKTFYIQKNNTQQGPFSINELIDLNISKETMVWHEDLTDWTQASNVEELKELFVQKESQKKTPPPFTPKIDTKSKDLIEKKRYKSRNIIIALIFSLLTITILAFFIRQNNQNEILQKQLEEQSMKIQAQELIEETRKQAEYAAIRQKEFSKLSKQLDNAVVNLRAARLKLEDIKQFKLLRTPAEKEQEIEEQLSNIRNWEKEVQRLKSEVDNYR